MVSRIVETETETEGEATADENIEMQKLWRLGIIQLDFLMVVGDSRQRPPLQPFNRGLFVQTMAIQKNDDQCIFLASRSAQEGLFN